MNTSDVEQRARELLAAALESAGLDVPRKDVCSETLLLVAEVCLSAIAAALSQQPVQQEGEAQGNYPESPDSSFSDTGSGCESKPPLSFLLGVLEGLALAGQECNRLTTALDNSGEPYRRPAPADMCARFIRKIYAARHREIYPDKSALAQQEGR